ncbi:hypothetical protein ABBQ38_012495 [Trebouxia sp. C0009 RCD-2024]
MFARPAPPEPQRRPAHFASHQAARSNGTYSKVYRPRGESGHFKDHGSPKRQLTLPDRETRKMQTRDWKVKSEQAVRSSAQQLEAGLSDASVGGNLSTPRAVKAAQHVADPGVSSLGSGSAPPVSLGTGAFHPGVPPGMPAYFRSNSQAQPASNSEGHSGQWRPPGGQSAPTSHARDAPESVSAGAFSRPVDGPSAPQRPKSLRRSANHVYIAHMIVECQHQMRRLNGQQASYEHTSISLPHPASMHHPSEPASQRSQSGSLPPAAPRQSSPSAPIKQEHSSCLPQQSIPPSSAMPNQAPPAFQFPSPFTLSAGVARPPTSQHLSGPRDSSGNIIPPAQYYKNMLGPQKFEALQPRLPLLQPGATWPMGPPGAPSPFASGPAMSPQQAAAIAAQMSMLAAAPHTLPGFPPALLPTQLGSSQGLPSSLFPRGMRWPDGTKDGVSIQELSVASTASPAVSDAKPEAKQVASKPIKQEDGKPEMVGPAVSNIPADALNRLIAMGGPAGFLDSHNLAQFGVPEHVLQAISKPNIHSQNIHSQDGRSLR